MQWSINSHATRFSFGILILMRRKFRPQLMLLAATSMAAAACAQAAQRSAGSIDLLSEGAIRSATAEIIHMGQSGRFRVDPEPIPPALDADEKRPDLSAEAMKHDTGMAQLNELQRIGSRMAGDSLSEGCAGSLLPYQPETLHRMCPREPETILVLGRPRADGSVIDSLRASQKGATRELRIVRVIETGLAQYGRSTTVADYVVGLEQNRWILVAQFPRLFIE